MLTIDTEQEDDGRWIAEITALPGVMAYGSTKPRRGKKPPRSLSGSLPNVLSMGSRCRTRHAACSRSPDGLARGQGWRGPSGAASHRLDDQATVRLPPHAGSLRVAQLCVRVP